MNKVLIVIMFILLGTSLIVVSNMSKGVENSFAIEYQNNKNLALPDLTGKTEISTGLYRLYNANGITVNYNYFTGIYTINGSNTTSIEENLFIIEVDTQYTLSYIAVSGSLSGGPLYFTITPERIVVIRQDMENVNKTVTFQSINNNAIRWYIGSGRTFNNYMFKLQLEKGSIATSYVVPKLIPVYKDNLTQKEKNDIGIGAFGGITKIIKTVSDIIKPVGDFANWILNLF